MLHTQSLIRSNTKRECEEKHLQNDTLVLNTDLLLSIISVLKITNDLFHLFKIFNQIPDLSNPKISKH